MKHRPLPFLISIPHGGTKIPPELADRVIITPHDLFDDSDAFTREMYDVDDLVVHVIKADIARAFVDVSRAPNQMPPEFPDGLFKSCTCLLKPIYAENEHPGEAVRRQLISRYYESYHKEIKKWCHDPRIRLGLDCHSMLPVAPPVAPDAGQKRPLINLGNLNGKSCPEKIVSALADSFCAVFDFSTQEVCINYPFKGGYITQKYAHHPIPWIQIEMNRILYLNDKWFNRELLQMDRTRLTEIHTLFAHVLEEFHQRLGYIQEETGDGRG
ncbi:N-formylglutamate amidohydrolase [candidate division KSB1 bacterium]|nr:N-formylglutamate amidohydrolase [candidate division KSB1 bacterium]